MDVVINHLYFSAPPDQAALEALERETVPAAREIPGFRSAHLIRIDDEHYVVLVTGDSVDALNAVASGPGGAWVTRHLAPGLAKPPERYVGHAVAGGSA